MAEGLDLPDLGVGIIFFPGLEPVIEAAGSALDAIEVEPQPISRIGPDGQMHLRADLVDFLAAQPRPVLVHSVGAPVAGTIHSTDMLVPAAEAVAVLRSPWASEHLNFDHFPTPNGAQFANFLLPALQSPQTIALAAANIRAMRSILEVPIAVETPVNYLLPYPGELSDGAFLRGVAEQADCGLLLDLHNLQCNQRNGRQSVLATVAELPLDRVWEVHLAGGQEFNGYRVDAHSGLIEDDLWELAEQVVPQLPNLKAINFEMMPEYLQSKRISTSAIIEQFDRMRTLWTSRGTRCTILRRFEASGERAALPDAGAWEGALGAHVTSKGALSQSSRDPADPLATDPGVLIYAQMIHSVRCGVVVDALRLTYRLLALTIGRGATNRLLRRYVEATGARQVPEHEIRQFAEWLARSGPRIPHLHEVAAFEVGVITAHTRGQEATIAFTREPIALLEALGAGRLPDPAEQHGNYAITVTP